MHLSLAQTSPTKMNSKINGDQDREDHIVFFPFMAKGHTIPLLHFAAALQRHHPSILTTFITTPSNAPFIRGRCRSLPNVRLVVIPFPNHPSLPPGCESTDSLPSFDLYPIFLAATALLRRPFESALRTLALPPPLCVVSDFFFGWTLDICGRLRIPRMVFHGMSAFSMAMCKSIWTHLPMLPDVDSGEPFHVPGMPPDLLLTRREIPETVLKSTDQNDPGTRFLSELGDSDVNSWGVLVNSFVGVEGEYAAIFGSFYRNGARAWLVGPLCLYTGDDEGGDADPDECIDWLDEQDDRSVVYVSFGTQAHVPSEQLDEVAHGLVGSGYRFLWALGPVDGRWAPPDGLLRAGKIVRWAPQREVLKHRAAGGFVTHCGWNSVMEGVSAGVPMLAWPMIAEQRLNTKLVVDELGMGLRLTGGDGDGGSELVRREKVSEGVRVLMGGDGGGGGGGVIRERVVSMSERAKEAVGEGGPSRRRLEELVEELRKCRSAREVPASEMINNNAATVDGLQLEFGDGIQIARW